MGRLQPAYFLTLCHCVNIKSNHRLVKWAIINIKLWAIYFTGKCQTAEFPYFLWHSFWRSLSFIIWTVLDKKQHLITGLWWTVMDIFKLLFDPGWGAAQKHMPLKKTSCLLPSQYAFPPSWRTEIQLLKFIFQMQPGQILDWKNTWCRLQRFPKCKQDVRRFSLPSPPLL